MRVALVARDALLVTRPRLAGERRHDGDSNRRDHDRSGDDVLRAFLHLPPFPPRGPLPRSVRKFAAARHLCRGSPGSRATTLVQTQSAGVKS